jgi:DNA-binding Lrp family transcriptional regulator
MDGIDKRLINRIQSDFPITSRPYQQLGQELGVSEQEVISRLERLKQQGVIRRLGAVFDSKKLGFASTLVALKVPPARVDEVAAVINGYQGVTHNYLRQAEYNMWFTLTAPSPQRLTQIIEEIKQRTGISQALELPAVKLFKIKVDFRLENSKNEGA